MGTQNEQMHTLGFSTSSCNSDLLSVSFVWLSSSSDIAKGSRALLDVYMDFILRNLRLLVCLIFILQSAIMLQKRHCAALCCVWIKLLYLKNKSVPVLHIHTSVKYRLTYLQSLSCWSQKMTSCGNTLGNPVVFLFCFWLLLLVW